MDLQRQRQTPFVGPDPEEQRWWQRWSLFLILSLLLHVFALLRLEGPAPAPTAPAPMRVRLARLPKQIVDAPPVDNARRPENAELLGRRDQQVEREMIAPDRGRAENGGQAVPRRNVERRETQQQRQEPVPAARDGSLSRFLPDPLAPPTASAQKSRQQNAIERPVGPVTLLNTKSSPFADYLIDRGYRALRLLTLNAELASWYAGDVRRLRFPAIVEATVDAEGEILATRLVESSYSGKVDHMLLTALRGALRGEPPPAEALRDGRATIVLALTERELRIGIR